MIKHCKYIIVLLSLVFELSSNAQKDYCAAIFPIPTEADCPLVSALSQLTDSISIHKSIGALTNGCRELGWLAFNIDTIFFSTDTVHLHLYNGSSYSSSSLKVDSVTAGILKKINYGLRTNYSWAELNMLREKILHYCENNGYPFAKINIQPIDNDPISRRGNKDERCYNEGYKLTTDLYKRVLLDTIQLYGNVKLAKRILYRHFGLVKGEMYNEAAIKAIPARIKSLGYASADRPASMLFLDNLAYPIIHLKKNKINRFDFLLGFLPAKEKGDKAQITGEGHLELHNILAQAERIKLNYRNYPKQEKRFDIALAYPYLPFVPAGIEFAFGLLLQDTLFRDIGYKPGLFYEFFPQWEVKVFYDSKRTNLLYVDTLKLAQGVLPAQLDMKRSFWGIGVNGNTLDELFNPRKGWSLEAQISIGKKNLEVNSAIKNYMSQHPERINPYDTLSLKTTQLQSQLLLKRYSPLGKQSTLLSSLASGWLSGIAKSADPNFSNEKFRLGGFRLMRGFDENSILVDGYIQSTLEYRYLLGKYSYLALFVDQAYFANFAVSGLQDSWNYGVGAGFNFETKAGLFSLYYALGADIKLYTYDPDKSPQFRNGKIHFGYNSFF